MVVLSQEKKQEEKGEKMQCPFCANDDTKVLESRVVEDALRRRRECLKCSNRFTTYERASFNLMVLKKDGRLQPYDPRKIAGSIEKACGKAEEEVIQRITQNVERKILRKKMGTIKTTDIGHFVLQELKKFDKIAYVRFASIHKGIDDPRMLQREVSRIAKKRD